METHAAWLVDMGYVVKASENIFKLDYIAALRYLTNRLGSVQAFLFNGCDPAYGIPSGLQAFYDIMQQYGFNVCLQPMESGPRGTNRQRGVDVDFTAHFVWLASLSQFETIILTTGDRDFLPAVKLVQNAMCAHIVLFSYRSMVHNELSSTVDEWWLFEDAKTELAR